MQSCHEKSTVDKLCQSYWKGLGPPHPWQWFSVFIPPPTYVIQYQHMANERPGNWNSLTAGAGAGQTDKRTSRLLEIIGLRADSLKTTIDKNISNCCYQLTLRIFSETLKRVRLESNESHPPDVLQLSCTELCLVSYAYGRHWIRQHVRIVAQI